jgi:porphobilinogen synthase
MLLNRPRRLRYLPAVRDLVRETIMSMDDFILPLFIRFGKGENTPISSMPGQYQITLENLPKEIETIVALNIKGVILFGIPEHKDDQGSEGFNDQGIVQKAIRLIKKIAPDLLVISDICCCEYTTHGHCGIIKKCGESFILDNDTTLEILQKQALSHAKAGADIIAPSGMIDGMVGAIREALDENNFSHVPILSYAVKYSSSLYAPFREAANGAPQFGNRKTYQMDPANTNEALREAELDMQEGADMLMVKPAGAYLDIIYRVKENFPELPLAAYQVSGEYAMIKAATEKGWIDEKKVVLETTLAIKRAGADFIITYFAKDLAKYLKD